MEGDDYEKPTADQSDEKKLCSMSSIDVIRYRNALSSFISIGFPSHCLSHDLEIRNTIPRTLTYVESLLTHSVIFFSFYKTFGST